MDPITAGLIAMGVGGALKGAAGLFDDSASKRADLMRQQAQTELSGLEETMRRQEGQQTQVLSSTKARMASSGFSSASKSFDNYLTGMAEQFQLQNQFTREKGQSNVDYLNRAADITGDVGMSKAFNLLGTVADTGGSFAGLFKGMGDTDLLAKIASNTTPKG